MSIDVTMFQQAFFDEATELLNDLEGRLLDLEDSKEDKELLNTIFRCAHSIKGGSSTFGLPAIANFTHGLETLLDKVRSGAVPVTSELCTVLFKSLDMMRALLAEAMGTGDKVEVDGQLSLEISRLSEVTAGTVVLGVTDKTLPTPPTVTHYELSFAPGFDVMRTGGDPCLLLGNLRSYVDILSVERDDSKVPVLEDLDPEACYVSWKIHLESNESPDEILDAFDFISDESEITLTAIESEDTSIEVEELSANPEIVKSAAKESRTQTDVSMLRVSSEKIDRLVDLVGELVISQSMLNEAAQEVEIDRHPRILEAIASIERSSRELQERVMGIRLVQLKHAFARFPRLVRDLSATVGKKIELVTVGEETELDKTLIGALGDPLTHLVRNSIDHGFETPAERKTSGKPEIGTLKISSRYEGGSVVIEVADDGRGLSKEKILAKAREKGLLSPDEIVSDDQIYSLIFQPGFSTAAAVTDLSGRGVGMDIVRQAIRSMNGSITLSSTPGKGTTFKIRLPLTMAILEGLSLRIGEEVYILPLTSIIESLRPLPEEITLVAGQHEVVRVRGEVLRILRLHQAFEIDGAIENPCEALLVIVENEQTKVALLVDELITQNQAVIKSLEANYRKVVGITGATIMGDGRVALIIDVPGLLRGINTDEGLLAAAA